MIGCKFHAKYGGARAPEILALPMAADAVTAVSNTINMHSKGSTDIAAETSSATMLLSAAMVSNSYSVCEW